MIITIGNTKGGVGKTTLALNIALGLALRGRDVWLIDGDRQGTASTAIQIRGEIGVVPVIACAQYTDGAALMAQVKHQAGKFQDIVIDAGGRDSTALRAAIMLSDIIVIPFQPRSIDIWALEDISSLLDEARAMGASAKALAVLSMADPGGADNDEARAAVADFQGLELAVSRVGRRKSFSNAAGAGQTVLEYSPVDQKARAEINQLLDEITK